MSGFFENLLKDAVGGFFGSDYLRDYTHASKNFRPNAYQHAPKLKFLFHVYFEVNQELFNPSDFNYGLLVKTVKLPSYTFATHELNQYNRKRIVQTKIKYDPIDIEFHDDNGNSIRNLWYKYYTYYYKDATKIQTGGPGSSGVNPSAEYTERTTYKPSITGNDDWGYIGESTGAGATAIKAPFFKNITIFGMDQHKYVAYTLINPIITKFNHDTYNYAEGNGTMQNTMTIDYETVKYYDGSLAGNSPSNIISGFGLDANYDRTTSPISVPGSQNNILGQGGLVSGVNGVINDLASGNILGAVKTAGTAYNTFKNPGALVGAVKNEVLTGISNSVQQTPNRNNIFQFPTVGQTPSVVVGTGLSSPKDTTINR